MGIYDGAVKQADAVYLSSIIEQVDELQRGEDEEWDWEDTTREERYWANLTRKLALILLEQTGYVHGLERDDDGTPRQ